MTGRSGQLQVICGCMFSGKTEELIRRIRRHALANRSVRVFKPTIDRRYHATHVTSHGAQSLAAVTVADVAALTPALPPDVQVVGIDEGQFFGSELVRWCLERVREGRTVIVSLLDLDYLGNPFEPCPQLLAVADEITKLHAVCVDCGENARRSYRLTDATGRVQVGAAESYAALCTPCYEKRSPI